ncbi:HinT-interacting membrane complex protein P80 [Mycoplasmopsis iners]|uniref:HinT-interacting membrane complex protein P80 n=1 Tax=Mycoplasmopsis iners TaxID=76630 RepID=UPI0004966EF4|nr:hypothetical protein [Mycoplasmopsis iners]
MAKRKESFFERLTKKNAEHENSVVAKPKKRKSKKILIIGSILTAAVVTGITVPLVVTGTKTTVVNPMENNKVVYSFTTPSGSNVNINVGQLQKINDGSTKTNYQGQLDQINKLAIYYLYDQEVEASKQYESLWNASLKSGEVENTNLHLKSIAELKTQVGNELKDIKQNIIKKFGYDNWETQYNNFLVANYDGATTEQEAIDNSVFSRIKNDALRRFRLSTQSVSNLIDRVANHDIKDPKTNEVIIKKGEKVFSWLKEIRADDLTGNYFKVDDKYIGFTTESYVVEQKSANAFIENYLKTDNPYLITQFTLPGIVKVKNDGDWTVNKDAFKRLMFAWPVSSNEENTIAYSHDKVKEYFKPFDDYVNILNNDNSEALPLQARIYNDVLSKLSADDTTIKNNFGTKGITSLSSLFNNSDDALKAFLAIKDTLLGTSQIKEIDLFGKLAEIQEAILADQNITKPTFDNAADYNAKKEAISKFNESIEKAFNAVDETKDQGLYDKKYKQLVTNKIAEIFEIADEVKDHKQIFTFYKLANADNTYILLTTKGITLVNLQTVADGSDTSAQINQIIKMIKNDYILTNKFNQFSGVKYNALSVINKSLTEQTYVNNLMLNDEKFVEYLKTQVNVYNSAFNSSLSENPKYNDEDIDNLKSINNNIYKANNAEKALSLTENISQWMKTRAQNEADGYFKFENNQVYFTNNKTQTADKLLDAKLKELLKVFQNR